MIIVAAQVETIAGRYAENERTIVEAITEASVSGAELVLFPELTLSGYPLGDLTLYPEFLAQGEDALLRVVEQIPENLAVGLGYIAMEEESGFLVNRYSILLNGEIVHTQDRYLIPQGEVLEGTFTDTSIRQWEYKGETFSIAALPDLSTECDWGDTIIIPATPLYTKGHASELHLQLKETAAQLGRGITLISAIGSYDDMLFAGGSLCCDARGNTILQAPLFEEAILLFHAKEEGSWKGDEPTSPYEEVEKAIIYGMRSYLHKSGFTTVNLGLSGGVDSALVAALAVKALGPDQVHGYLMPSPYSSEGSITDAVALAENLGIGYNILPITPLFEEARATLAPAIGVESDLMEENLQARIRGILLMGHSNRKGSLLLATGNKSEFAVGYSTLYGDLCGGLAPIGDLYKTEVFELCRYINRDEELIPEAIITKPPSAELRPGQKDEDSLPPYEILDQILYHHLEGQCGPMALRDLGFNREMVERVLHLIKISEYKRRQAPPTLRLTECNFGSGRNIPIIR